MQIRVDVDDRIDASQELMIRVEGVVEGSLDRFQGRIARVDVHLSQLSRPQPGHLDMCCRMEAYAGALAPIVVTHEAVTLTEAIHASAAKLARAVGAALGRQKGKVTEPDAPGGAAEEDGLGPLRSS